jgi:ribonuclease III
MQKTLKELANQINIDFKNEKLLAEAMTHKSYSVENSLNYDNQRLEFLGDAVLQILITEYLYVRYIEEQEGKLTKMRSVLARQEALATLARKLELQDYIRMGRGEIKNNGTTRDSTLCDAFEALAGAIYLDAGLSPVANLLMPMLKETFPEPIELLDDINPKGILQEYTQQHCKSETPEYIIENKDGPDHDCTYSVAVLIKGKIIGRGSGKSRKSSEMSAAANAIEALKAIIKDD